nr:YqgE/AlgH family protein [Marimonas lutisalis]
MDLTGKLLIAMPGMGDPRFEKSVVFMCAHSDEGAMGLIVNKPTGDLSLKDMIEQLEIGDGSCEREIGVHYGGPVEHGRGFVLHSGEYVSAISTLRVDDRFGMTATLDILEEMAAGRGPEKAIMALGYAGWGPGQLENEILANGWLTTEASAALVFDTPDATKWSAALKTLGVDPLTLSAAAGRA